MGGENAQRKDVCAPSKEGVVKEDEGVLMLAKKVPSELSTPSRHNQGDLYSSTIHSEVELI